MKKIEVERKFLLKNPVKIDQLVQTQLIQHVYLSPGTRYSSYTENDETTFKKVVKSTGENLAREESVENLSEEEFLSHYFKSEFPKITKTRTTYFYKDLKIEIDVFETICMVMMEVEKVFKDEAEATNFIETFENQELDLPESIKNNILIEVTGQPEFYNYNLAKT